MFEPLDKLRCYIFGGSGGIKELRNPLVASMLQVVVFFVLLPSSLCRLFPCVTSVRKSFLEVNISKSR